MDNDYGRYADQIHDALNNKNLFRENKRGKYTYNETDNGKMAEGNLKLQKGERDPKAQKEVGGGDRRWDDDGGHLIGSRFMGAGDEKNLDAQNRSLNRGAYSKMERQLADELKAGNKVFLHVETVKSNGSQRPDSYEGYAIVQDKQGNREVRPFQYANENPKPREITDHKTNDKESYAKDKQNGKQDTNAKNNPKNRDKSTEKMSSDKDPKNSLKDPDGRAKVNQKSAAEKVTDKAKGGQAEQRGKGAEQSAPVPRPAPRETSTQTSAKTTPAPAETPKQSTPAAAAAQKQSKLAKTEAPTPRRQGATNGKVGQTTTTRGPAIGQGKLNGTTPPSASKTTRTASVQEKRTATADRTQTGKLSTTESGKTQTSPSQSKLSQKSETGSSSGHSTVTRSRAHTTASSSTPQKGNAKRSH